MPPATHRDSSEKRQPRLEAQPKAARAPQEGEYLERQLREHYELTRSEAEVARHLVEGLGYSEIAELLGISYHTVHSHVKVIHSKTGSTTNGKLIALFRRDLRL